MRDLECKLSVFWWAMYQWKENSCTHRVKRGRGQGLGNESVENKVRPELPLSAGHTPPPEKNFCHQRHVSKGVLYKHQNLLGQTKQKRMNRDLLVTKNDIFAYNPLTSIHTSPKLSKFT